MQRITPVFGTVKLKVDLERKCCEALDQYLIMMNHHLSDFELSQDPKKPHNSISTDFHAHNASVSWDGPCFNGFLKHIYWFEFWNIWLCLILPCNLDLSQTSWLQSLTDNEGDVMQSNRGGKGWNRLTTVSLVPSRILVGSKVLWIGTTFQ